jgi:hypothetical protein
MADPFEDVVAFGNVAIGQMAGYASAARAVCAVASSCIGPGRLALARVGPGIRAHIIADEWLTHVIGHPKAGHLRDGKLSRAAFCQKSRFETGEAR